MKKPLLALISGLTTTLHVAAQQPAPLRARTPSTDTINAVEKMFQKHRTGGVVWTIIGAAFAGRIIGAAAGGGSDAGGAAVSALALGGIPAGIGIGKLVRFSSAKEEETLTTYSTSNKLPHYVKRRLKRKKYFSL